MTRYRLKLEKIEGSKYTHLANFSLSSIEGIEECIRSFEGRQQWEREKTDQLMGKAKEKFYSDIKNNVNYDAQAKGEDISHEEFIENEYFNEEIL